MAWPAVKRQAVDYVVDHYATSHRRACRIAQQHRRMQYYRSRMDPKSASRAFLTDRLEAAGDGTGPRTMAGTSARACCAARTRRQRGASGQRRSSSCSVRKRPCRRRPSLRRGYQINGCHMGLRNATSRNAPRIDRYRHMADASARYRATGNKVFSASARRI